MKKKCLLKRRLSFIVKYPNLYRVIYKTHNFIKFQILGPGTKTQLFTLIPLIFFLHFNRKAVVWTTLYTVLIIIGFWTISKLSGLFINRILKNIGSDDKFIFPGKYLIKQHGSPFIIDIDHIQKGRFEFATVMTARKTAELNMKGFKNSAWHTTEEDKFKRNLSHIQQNKKSILLVRAMDGSPIGFTHIFPVKESTWKRYKQGNIGDNHFSAANVFSDRSLNKPYGLILFSVVAAERVKDFTNAETYSNDIGDLLEQAIAYHLQNYIDIYFTEVDEVPVLFQSESSIFLKPFFSKGLPVEISHDGARIITFEIDTARKIEKPQDGQKRSWLTVA